MKNVHEIRRMHGFVMVMVARLRKPIFRRIIKATCPRPTPTRWISDYLTCKWIRNKFMAIRDAGAMSQEELDGINIICHILRPFAVFVEKCEAENLPAWKIIAYLKDLEHVVDMERCEEYPDEELCHFTSTMMGIILESMKQKIYGCNSFPTMMLAFSMSVTGRDLLRPITKMAGERPKLMRHYLANPTKSFSELEFQPDEQFRSEAMFIQARKVYCLLVSADAGNERTQQACAAEQNDLNLPDETHVCDSTELRDPSMDVEELDESDLMDEDVALTPEEEEALIAALTEIMGSQHEQVAGMGSTYWEDLRASNCELLDNVFGYESDDRVLIDGLLTQLVDDIKQEGVTSKKVIDAWTYWIIDETDGNPDLCALWKNLGLSNHLTWISDIAIRMTLVASEASAERLISCQRRLIMKGMYHILPDLFEARSRGMIRTVKR